MQESEAAGFTGRTRKRTTRKSVVVIDKAARSLITVGGIGTIIAVIGVFFFLVWVVLPLFVEADITDAQILPRDTSKEPFQIGLDEYQLLGWALQPSGRLDVFRLDTGEVRSAQQIFEPGDLVSASFLLRGNLVAFGTREGLVRLGQIGFETQVLDAEDLPTSVVNALEGKDESFYVDHEDGVVQPTRQGQYRVQRLDVKLGEETRVGEGAVHRIDHVIGPNGPLIAALTEDANGYNLNLILGVESSNFLTGESSIEFGEPISIPFEAMMPGMPDHIALAGSGSTLYAAWADGSLVRYDISSPSATYAAEQLRIVDAGRQLTALDFILGNNTLVWGDSEGRTNGGFLLRFEEYEGQGGGQVEVVERDTDRSDQTFVQSKRLESGRSPALSLAASARSRLLLTGFENGKIIFSNVTNQATLATFEVPTKDRVTHLVMAPKEDGLLALTPSGFFHARLDPGYPEASFGALFRPVWYEGYSEPKHIWQSSSATDDFEMKLGLMPLVFGTLKATFYSMLFGVPLALLAAIFTSEFLQPKAKSVIKPSIELMASLPSVVLGFLAALVFAPVVEKVVPATLTGFVTVPLVLLIGAYLWQLLPSETAIRLESKRFFFILAVLPIGVLLALATGPWVEKFLFAGDIKGWLTWDSALSPPELDHFRAATGGWMLLLIPLSLLVTAFTMSRFVNPWMRSRSADWSRKQFGLADFAKFAIGVILVFGMAYIVSAILSSMGLDPRGSYVDTYVQRNALIVGFVMGFAIIPIIYTISEDALSTVPDHLRSASLGAGATPWQTATRIVIPTAMSGLFSAMMVGLGRAVGETMIVLMAAGNTAVMEWNIFEGFRTLSANIAVELPEAVRNSTHYRTLFLAALTLFAMTFIVNTVAEIIRLRFRKRAYQL